MTRENEEINILDIVKLMAKYWVLILLLTATIVYAAYSYTSRNIKPMYESSVILFIGKDIGNEDTLNITDIQVGKQLIADYREMIKTDLVVETVISELSLDISPSVLRDALSIKTIGESRFLEISYVSDDPQSAIVISNKIAEILVSKSIEILKENNIQVIDNAKDEPATIEPGIMMNTAVAFFLGLIFSLFVTLMIVMLRKTYHNERDVEKNTNLLVLGVIPSFRNGKNTNLGSKNIISFADYNSVISKSINLFRINLEYSGINNNHKILMFTTPESDDGKAISIINTAVSYVQTGKKVLLIECDYYNNKLHKLLQLPQMPGLKHCVLDEKKNLLETVRAVAGTENMSFLPSGIMSQDQANIFSLPSFSELLEVARTKFDIVLINTTPVMSAIDAVTISTKVDAIVLVIDQKRTKKAVVSKALKLLGKGRSNIIGILVNSSTGNAR